MSDRKKAETANAFLEYNGNIVYVRMKEDSDVTIQSMKEQYKAQAQLVKDEEYAVLVDGTNNVNVPPATREFMAKHSPANRKATAIITNQNLATLLIANFYVRFNRPAVPTRLFKNETVAVHWLKKQLKKNQN